MEKHYTDPIVPANFKREKKVDKILTIKMPKSVYVVRLFVASLVSIIITLIVLGLYNGFIRDNKISEVGVTVLSSGEYVRVPKGTILYGDVSEIEEVIGTDKYDGFHFVRHIKTPYLTEKSILVSTDSVCVVFKDKYNLGDGKAHANESQDKILKKILGEDYILSYNNF